MTCVNCGSALSEQTNTAQNVFGQPNANQDVFGQGGATQGQDAFGNPHDSNQGGQPFGPQFADPAAMQDQINRRRLNSALVNGVLGIAMSIWTLIVVFAQMFNVWGMFIWIAIDFTCSIPAIVNAVRGRAHSRTKFMIALSMGILSTIASLVALIYWAMYR